MELVIHTIPAGHPLHDYVDSFWMHSNEGPDALLRMFKGE